MTEESTMSERKPNPNRDRARELARQIANLPDAERAALAMSAPVLSVDGRPLSFKNSALVAMQKPDATIVGGFKQWIGAGRIVRRGESAIYIWIPSTRAAPVDTGDASEAGGAAEMETRFFMAPVFDVSQTAEIGTVESEAGESAPMAIAA
jgi:hypothetical protein